MTLNKTIRCRRIRTSAADGSRPLWPAGQDARPTRSVARPCPM